MKQPVARQKIDGRSAELLMQARAAVLDSTPWLTRDQWYQRIPKPTTYTVDQLDDWKCRRAVFSIYLGGSDLYPAYAFGEELQPLPMLRQLIAILAEKDDWRLACWFASVNGRLGGRRPQDLLLDCPADVLSAAHVEADGVQHG